MMTSRNCDWLSHSLTIALLVLMAGCDVDPEFVRPMEPDSTSTVVALVDFKVPVGELSSRPLVSGAVLGRPLGLGATGGNIVVTDLANDPAIHVFDAATGNHLWSEGRQGEGPGEFLWAPKVVSSMTGPAGLQWLLDSRTRRFVGIDPRIHPSRRSEPGGMPNRTVAPIPASQLMEGAQIDDTTMVITVAADQAPPSVARLDLRSGNVSDSTWQLDALNPQIVGMDITSSMAHNLCADPDGSRIAILYRHAGVGEIRAASGAPLHEIATPVRFVPPAQKTLFRKGMFKNGEVGVRLGYLGCAATANHLIALYSGVLVSSSEVEEDRRYLHVFDWTGHLLSVWRLDHAPHAIAVDRTGATLYSIVEGRDDGSASIRVTALPARDFD